MSPSQSLKAATGYYHRICGASLTPYRSPNPTNDGWAGRPHLDPLRPRLFTSAALGRQLVHYSLHVASTSSTSTFCIALDFASVSFR